IENTRNSTGSGGNYRDFVVLHRAARMAVMGIAAIKKIGSLGSTAQDARARAFARFVQGVAFGNLALAYDSVDRERDRRVSLRGAVLVLHRRRERRVYRTRF